MWCAVARHSTLLLGRCFGRFWAAANDHNSEEGTSSVMSCVCWPLPGHNNEYENNRGKRTERVPLYHR
uniref:Putative secreted protein n=1 Tax=Anopheles marajoara TaxID=58244 RepID=A0A2M4CGF7_9DIPT